METRKIKLTFYKQSGKFYTEGTATVTASLYDSAYLSEILRTQDALSAGWEDGDWWVAVSPYFNNPHAGYFDHHLFHSSRFRANATPGDGGGAV